MPNEFETHPRTQATPSKGTHAQSSPVKATAKPIDAREAWGVVDTAADILANDRGTSIHGLSPADTSAMWKLLAAKTGRRERETLDGVTRRALFQEAMGALGAAIAAYGRDPSAHDWLDDHITSQLKQLRSQLEYVVADDHVRRSITLDGKHVIDPDDNSRPREQAGLLHAALPKLVKTIAKLNDLVLRAHDAHLEKQVEQMIAGHFHGRSHLSSLLELGNALALIDGFLTLKDDELRKKLAEQETIAGRLATISELVKATLQFTSGAIGVVASATGLIAKLARQTAAADLAFAMAKGIPVKLGDAFVCIETLHGIAVLCDSDATRQERIDGGVDVASGALWLAYRFAKVAPAGPASIAIASGYELFKVSMHMYWGAALGLVSGLMRPAFEMLQRYGLAIAAGADDVVKARALRDREGDIGQQQALDRVLEVKARLLGNEIDSLVTDLQAPDLEAGMARLPGAYPILRDALRPVLAYRGRRSADEVLEAARIALDRIEWIAQHAEAIVTAAASHKGLADVRDERTQEVPHEQ